MCVAQALHWFDVERFWAEVRRVLRPGGVVLVTGYGWFHVSPEFDAAFERCVLEPLKPHWPAQNALLINQYRDLPFPFERIEMPELRLEMSWTLAQLLDYIGTWTAARRIEAAEPGFMARAAREMATPWGTAATRAVVMPLLVICGRHHVVS